MDRAEHVNYQTFWLGSCPYSEKKELRSALSENWI